MFGLIILVPIIYIAIAWVIVKRLHTKKVKAIALVIFIIIPMWDEIIGRIYFKNLCETEAGGQTFKTVELGKEFFLRAGEIDSNTAGRLPAKGGELNILKVEEHFPIVRRSTEISSIFKINKYEVVITEKPSSNVIARHNDFHFFGGWVARHSTPHVSGIGCPLPDGSYSKFYAATFKPTKRGG